MKNCKVALDQFYTNPLIAKKLTSIFTTEIKKLGYPKISFIEPSAGTGNFLEAIREVSKNIGKEIITCYQKDIPKEVVIEFELTEKDIVMKRDN